MDIAWCIADPHFEPSAPSLETFRKFMAAFRASGVPTLIFLGDLFPVWVALPGAQSPDQVEVAALLEGLRSEGRTVVYLAGNRDYFLDALSPSPFTVLAERWDAPAEGGPIRFEHGDLINVSDEAYLRWRRFSRSRPVSLLFRMLPAGVQRRAALRMERSLDATNRPYKEYHPDAELTAWANDLKKRGYSGAVVGHFHRDAENDVDGFRVRFIPQFREDGAHLRLRHDGSWSLERIER